MLQLPLEYLHGCTCICTRGVQKNKIRLGMLFNLVFIFVVISKGRMTFPSVNPEFLDTTLPVANQEQRQLWRPLWLQPSWDCLQIFSLNTCYLWYQWHKWWGGGASFGSAFDLLPSECTSLLPTTYQSWPFTNFVLISPWQVMGCVSEFTHKFWGESLGLNKSDLSHNHFSDFKSSK